MEGNNNLRDADTSKVIVLRGYTRVKRGLVNSVISLYGVRIHSTRPIAMRGSQFHLIDTVAKGSIQLWIYGMQTQ